MGMLLDSQEMFASVRLEITFEIRISIYDFFSEEEHSLEVVYKLRHHIRDGGETVSIRQTIDIHGELSKNTTTKWMRVKNMEVLMT